MDLETNRLTADSMTPKQSEDVLDKIDSLIRLEEKKIQRIKQQEQSDDDLLTD